MKKKSIGHAKTMPTPSRLILRLDSFKEAFGKAKKYFIPKLLLQNPLFIAFLFVFSLIPLAFALVLIKNRFQVLEERQKEFTQIQWKSKKLIDVQKNRHAFLEKYHQVDSHYLDQLSDELLFLQSEIDALKIIYGHPTFQSCPAVKTRLHELTEEGNRLVFFEKGRQSTEIIQELRYHQQNAVEINTDDLKKILANLEGVTIGIYKPPFFPPSIVIDRFDLKRDTSLGRENYFLQMDIIKREPL